MTKMKTRTKTKGKAEFTSEIPDRDHKVEIIRYSLQAMLALHLVPEVTGFVPRRVTQDWMANHESAWGRVPLAETPPLGQVGSKVRQHRVAGHITKPRIWRAQM